MALEASQARLLRMVKEASKEDGEFPEHELMTLAAKVREDGSEESVHALHTAATYASGMQSGFRNASSVQAFFNAVAYVVTDDILADLLVYVRLCINSNVGSYFLQRLFNRRRSDGASRERTLQEKRYLNDYLDVVFDAEELIADANPKDIGKLHWFLYNILKDSNHDVVREHYALLRQRADAAVTPHLNWESLVLDMTKEELNWFLDEVSPTSTHRKLWRMHAVLQKLDLAGFEKVLELAGFDPHKAGIPYWGNFMRRFGHAGASEEQMEAAMWKSDMFKMSGGRIRMFRKKPRMSAFVNSLVYGQFRDTALPGDIIVQAETPCRTLFYVNASWFDQYPDLAKKYNLYSHLTIAGLYFLGKLTFSSLFSQPVAEYTMDTKLDVGTALHANRLIIFREDLLQHLLDSGADRTWLRKKAGQGADLPVEWMTNLLLSDDLRAQDRYVKDSRFRGAVLTVNEWKKLVGERSTATR